MPKFLRHVPPIEARAAMTSLTVALGLLILKFVAYFLTNSSAIFSDALESIANVTAAGFAMYALYMAHRPADSDHPYGHGKIEFLSAAFEGSMILMAALVAMLRGVDSIIHHVDGLKTEAFGIGVALLLIALIVNGLLGWSLTKIGRKADSATLQADGQHLLSDAITSVAAIIGLLAVWLTGWKYADPVAALVVAGYIGYIGIHLMRGAVSGLMDEQDQDDEKLLSSILEHHIGPHGSEPHICGYHKLRHRHSGRYHWVDFHITLPPGWNVLRAHQIATTIEEEIESALGIGNATAHIEPCDVADCPNCASGRNMTRRRDDATALQD